MTTTAPDAFLEVIDALSAAATTGELDAILLGYEAPAEHHALAELRYLQLAPAAGHDPLDTDTLAALLHAEAAGVRGANRDGETDAARLERIAVWAAEQHGRVPRDPRGWPCERCDAGPGQTCALGHAGVHVGRGFRIGLTHPGESSVIGRPVAVMPERCTPSLEHGPGQVNRGRCLGCAWRGDPVVGESDAVAAAHDHAFPGWRDLPVVPAVPQEFGGPSPAAKNATARWWREVAGVFPEGWLEAGGPIRTERLRPGTRDVPGRAPGGGYDLAVVLEAPHGATLHDVDDPDPANAAVMGETRRICAATGHARRRGPDGEVVYRDRVYCRCGRASYEPSTGTRRAAS